MASRADPVPTRAPHVPGVFRAAAFDFYVNSMRFVLANSLWGAAFLGILVASSIQPLFLLLVPLLAFPTVGMARIATLVVRGAGASFWDGLAAWRLFFVPTLLLGTGLAICGAVFFANIALGMATGGIIGWGLATLAGWGLVVTWLIGWTVWPVLVDPCRSAETVRGRLRTAALLVLTEPVRMIALGASLAVLVAVSAILFVALIMCTVAFASALCARVVLPAADRLDARRAAGSGSGAAAPA